MVAFAAALSVQGFAAEAPALTGFTLMLGIFDPIKQTLPVAARRFEISRCRLLLPSPLGLLLPGGFRRVAFQRPAIKVAPLARRIFPFQLRRLPLLPIGGQLELLLSITLSPLLLMVFTRFAFQ